MRILPGAIGGLFAGLALLAAPVSAQEFPTKQPVKIVVGANAGGLTDALARITAEFLQKRLNQAVVVENRAGAAATIAADFVAKAPADGYTLLLAGAEQSIAPAVRTELPYKYENFTFLIRPFVVQPFVLASPKFAPNTIPELVAFMKANPGKVRYGSTGVGAIVHMGAAMFEGATGTKAVHVPYTGIAPVYTDMLAGTIDITLGGTFPFPDGLKVLGSNGTKRSPALPNVPTLEESGVKGASWDVWFGFVAPPNLPKPVADRLIAEIQAVLKDPAAIEKIKQTAKIEPEAAPLIGDAFKSQAVSEVKAWKEVADREKVVVQQ